MRASGRTIEILIIWLRLTFRIFIFIIFILLSTLHADVRNSFVIQRIEEAPVIDGFLDETIWKKCAPLSGFKQFDPFNGEASSESTIVKLAYNSDYLFVAMECSDSQIDKIHAPLTPREGYYEGDYVSLILDTFNDQRTSYTFTLNPRGVQKDQPGDYLWESSGRIHENGWNVEFKIPFKSIRFPEQKIQTWGINFKRFIYRKKETSYYSHIKRDEVKLEKSAIIEGIYDIYGGNNLEIFPYLGYRSSRSVEQSDDKFAAGIDIRYGLTSTINLDATISPDFSEVISDPFFYQLTPYEYRLREQRPFFQESEQYLAGISTGIFYSRRITDPKIAGKITGKHADYTIGLIGAINKEEKADGYLGAFRIQKNILKFSTISALVSGYKNAEFKNMNGNLDLLLKTSEVFSISGRLAVSSNSDLRPIQNKRYDLTLNYLPDEGIHSNITTRRIEKNYEPRVGIFGVRDIQEINWNTGYTYRINQWGLKLTSFDAAINIKETTSRNSLGYILTPMKFNLQSIHNHHLGIATSIGTNKVQIDNDGELMWTLRKFDYRSLHIWTGYNGNKYYNLSLSLNISEKPVYAADFTEAFNGWEVSTFFSLWLKPWSNLDLFFENKYTKQEKMEGKQILFEGGITDVGFFWQISRMLFFHTVIQHDSYQNKIKMDLLLGLELGIGKTLTLSYKSRGASTIDRLNFRGNERTLIVKGSYLFRI
jgi:hypothetical protein